MVFRIPPLFILSSVTSVEVLLDKEGKEIYGADTFESPTTDQEMENPAFPTVFIKSESVCVTKTEKL